jgi:tetratricopeptide (TPR) repeat protein
MHFAAGEEDEARAVVKRIVSVDPLDPDRHRIAAQVFVRSGNYTDGIASYRAARVALQDSAIFAQDLARILEARREYSAAVDEYFRWLAASPRSSATVQKRITNLTRVPGATTHITEALKAIVLKSPENEYAHRLYGDLLFESGVPDSGFAEYHRADALSKTPGFHRLAGIKRSLETGRAQVARDEAVAFLADYPKHSKRIEVHFNLGKAELALGNPLVAIDLLQTLSALIPNPREQIRAQYEIGEIYRLHTERMDSAHAYFSRVVDLTGRGSLDQTQALLRLGELSIYFGDLAAADSIFRKASERPARQLTEEIAYRSAELLFFAGSYEESGTKLRDMIKSFPKGLYVNDAIGLSLIIRDGADAMTWSLDRFAAALLAIKQRRLDSAFTLFGVLAADSAGSLADDALYTRAGVHHTVGDYTAAVSDYETLVSRFPESYLVPRAWLVVGDLYATELGDPIRAREAYQTILAEYKSSPVVEMARRRLQEIGVP